MKLEIHPFTLEREKLSDHNFLNSYNKVSFEKAILAKETLAKEEGNQLADQISNSVFNRNSKKKKVIKKLRNLDLNFDYASISINEDIDSRLKKFQNQLNNIKKELRY